MKIEMNGIKFEDVSVEEALQLVKSTQIIEGKPMREKRKYTKRQKWISWDIQEKEYILANLNLSPKRLWIGLGKRHTKGAVSWMKYKLIEENRIK